MFLPVSCVPSEVKRCPDTNLCYVVSGAAGFMGAAFVHHILDTQPQATVVVVDALTYAGTLENLARTHAEPRLQFVKVNLTDTESLREIMSRVVPEVVVNFAAESHVDRSLQDPVGCIESNVLGTTSLLLACKKAWEKEATGFLNRVFLQVSTDEVYGSSDAGVVFTEESALVPTSPYSASKAAADLVALSFWRSWNMPVRVSRSSNNYGPRQHPEKLIPRTIARALAHKEIPVFGDGSARRAWLYVGDQVSALERVIQSGRNGCIYNIGSDEQRSCAEVVRMVLNRVAEYTDDAQIGIQLMQYVSGRPALDRAYVMESSKMHELGWAPQVSFELGIDKTVRWYLDHRGWLERRIEQSNTEFV